MKKLLFILLFSSMALAQAVRVDIPLLTTGPNVPSTGGPMPQMLGIANAAVQVCGHPAVLNGSGLCTNLITTYTDSTMSTACPSPSVQMVQLPGTTCSATTGQLANIGFWYAGGTVDYTISTTYGNYGPYTISPSPSGGYSVWFDVRTYGAKCDGITDDSAAAQAAENAAEAAGGGTVLMCPSGTTMVLGSASPMFEISKTAPVQVQIPAGSKIALTAALPNLPTPAAPTVVASSGTWPAGTYQFKVRYLTGGATSIAWSPETTVTLAAPGGFTLTAPTKVTYAQAYDIGISTTSGAETVQDNCGYNNNFTGNYCYPQRSNPGATAQWVSTKTPTTSLTNPFWQGIVAPSTSSLPAILLHNDNGGSITVVGNSDPGGGMGGPTIYPGPAAVMSNGLATTGLGVSHIDQIMWLFSYVPTAVVTDAVIRDCGTFTPSRHFASVYGAPNAIAYDICGAENDVYYSLDLTCAGGSVLGCDDLHIDSMPWYGDREGVANLNIDAVVGGPSYGHSAVVLNGMYGGANWAHIDGVNFHSLSLESYYNCALPGGGSGACHNNGLVSNAVNHIQVDHVHSYTSGLNPDFVPFTFNGQGMPDYPTNQLTRQISVAGFSASNSTTAIVNNVDGVSIAAASGNSWEIAPYNWMNPSAVAGVVSQLLNFTTDGTMVANSNTLAPTEAAIVSYVGGKVAISSNVISVAGTDGTFETGSATLGTGWGSYCAPGATCVFTRDNTTAYAGTYSQKLNQANATGYAEVYSNSMTIPAGVAYTIYGAMLSDGTSGTKFSVGISDAATGLMIYCPANYYLIPTSAWTAFSIPCPALALQKTDAVLRISTFNAPSGGGSVWVDNISVGVPVAAYPPFLSAAANKNVTGTGSSVCSATGSYTNGHIITADANSNCVDSGTALSSITGGASLTTKSQFIDDFYTFAGYGSGSIGAASGNSVSTNATYADQNHPGNIYVVSGTGGTGTGEQVNTGSVATIITPNTSLGWTWESAVYIPVLPSTTGGAYQAGLSASSGFEPWTASIQFHLTSTSGVPNDWYCRYNTTETDSTVVATVAWQRLTITNDGTKIHWYIGGTEVCGTGLAIASAPSTAMYPAWTATAKSATSMGMAVDYVTFQRAVVR